MSKPASPAAAAGTPAASSTVASNTPLGAATPSVTVEIGDGRGLAAATESGHSDSVNSEKPESPVCRICLDGASAGPLRQLCGCQGTIGRLHDHCLVRWLCLSKKDHCELCLQPLPVRVHEPGLLQYARHGPRRSHCLLAMDLFSLMLTLPLLVYCNLLSVAALQHFRELQYLKLRQYSFWEICFGVVITPFVLSGFLLWTCYVYKGHHSEYKKWQLDQRQVTLYDVGSAVQ